MIERRLFPALELILPNRREIAIHSQPVCRIYRLGLCWMIAFWVRIANIKNIYFFSCEVWTLDIGSCGEDGGRPRLYSFIFIFVVTA